MATWSIEQVLALAPDASSAKAGQGLGSAGKWLKLGRNERAVWGEIQGSAKDPYRAQADLSGPAFHCNCPSRKFPCKHGLGLMLIFAGHPAKVAEGPLPAWVTEWLAKRDASAERKAAKAEAADKPPDPETEAKREAARARTAARREDQVKDGIAELRVWLGDTVRNGLAHARQQAARSWETMAARLIDAKAPGAARLVREMEGLAVVGDDWADRLLERLGALQLLAEAYERIESLPEPLRADVRTTIGWTTSEEDLAAGEVAPGRWQVLGQRVEEEEKLRVQRTWLLLESSRRPALVLSFAPPGKPLDVSLVPGTVIDADLVFYPSNFPLRAQVRERRGEPGRLRASTAMENFAEALESTAAALSAQPWLERVPWCVKDCVPFFAGERRLLRDTAGQAVPLPRQYSQAWTLAALSGGRPFTVFGEWDGRVLLPLSVMEDGRFVALGKGA